MSTFLDQNLPTTPTGPLSGHQSNPRVVVIYGGYKIGKSVIASWISRNKKALWLDYEGGSAYVPGLKIDVMNQVGQLDKISPRINFLQKLWTELANESPKRYDYLIHDKLDNLEDWAEQWATGYYKSTVIGKNFGGGSVLELDKGGGYEYLRQKFKALWTMATAAAPHTVFFASLRDKQIEKADSIVSSNDLDLTGKVRKITAGFADAVGFMYRTSDGSNWLSFVTEEKGTFAGSRCPRLEGQRFRFSWKDKETGEIVVDWDRLFVPTSATEENPK